jgi:Ca2+-binding EF-hand superfamily protein
VLGAQALDKNPKVLEDRTFAEKSPDGQNIQYHYQRKEHSDGTTEIDVGSTDLMDTAEDMADSMADVPAKDIKSKDDTTKVLGETVFKSGVEDMEELEAEDPFMEQPIEDLGKDSAGLSTQQEGDLADVEKDLANADEQFEEGESKDAATEAVLSSRDQDMSELDANHDGMLDVNEVKNEIDHDMKETSEVSMLQQMKLETPALKKLIAIFDKNGDGELSFQELFGKESSAKQKVHQEEFKIADQNADGNLDTEELFDLHNRMWMQRWLEPQMFFNMKAEDHIEAMDTNGDGKVEWSEFASFMKPHIEAAMKEHGDHNLAMSLPEGPNDGILPEDAKDDRSIPKGAPAVGGSLKPEEAKTMEEHLTKFHELFNEADLNKDGSLSEEEMATNLKDRAAWMAYAAATAVVHEADDNKDNKLSLNEVIKNADKFGAKTEDFFEDKDLLDVDESGDGPGQRDLPVDEREASGKILDFGKGLTAEQAKAKFEKMHPDPGPEAKARWMKEHPGQDPDDVHKEFVQKSLRGNN